ncbi:MAG: 4Fe-4S dicluster domain-containing protein, partial [bacterium]|nr:4Fe-4S dicluster domain-containing protein [bacterium]
AGEPDWVRVFAPAAGRVGDRAAGMSACGHALPTLELTPDSDQHSLGDTPAEVLRPQSGEAADRLARLGIGLDPSRTAQGSPSREGSRTWAIIDGLESAPYAAARTRTLIEHPTEIVEAARNLRDLLRTDIVYLAVDRARRTLVTELRRLAKAGDLCPTILPLANLYPRCHPRQLARLAADHNGPSVSASSVVAQAVFSTCELLDIHRGLRRGRPPLTQTLTIGGDVIQRPGTYRIPLGMSVGSVLQSVGLSGAPARFVAGSAMTGSAVRTLDAVVVRGIEGLFAWSSARVWERASSGCLRCGSCLEVCPVRIDPIGIYSAVEVGNRGEAMAASAETCLDCGLCDYACPAELELMAAVQDARSSQAWEVTR